MNTHWSIKCPAAAPEFRPVNAKYLAEERCEIAGVEYNEKTEANVRELANDCLASLWFV